MKRIYGLFLALALLSSGNVFAQNTVLGRSVFEKEFYDHTYLDEDDTVKIRSEAKVIKWDYFADELVIEWNKPENSSLTLYAARVDALERANNQGVIQEILDPIHLSRNTYPFSQEDIVLQDKAGLGRFYSIRFRNTTPDRLYFWAREFEKDPAIKSVSLSPVFKIANHTYDDPLLPKQWNVPKISTAEAHHISFGSQSVYVFINDTGVFLDHEDIDKSRNFIDYDATSDKIGGDDDYGHGTHVYTTICAVANNGKGIVGLAANVRCGNIKVLSSGSGSFETVVYGFLVAASKAVEIKQKDPSAQFVMNCSFGGFGKLAVIDAAVEVARKAGILVVAAAGNSATNIDFNPFIPASSPGVIAVAATDSNDKLASFSNYGSKTVLVAAPGVKIWAGVPPNDVLMSNPSGYMASSGSSMASPHVASYAALILSTATFTEEKARFVLFANNDDVNGLTPFVASGGRINLALGLNVPKIPPSPIEDLNVDMGTSHSSARLAWTSPGDSNGQKLFGAKLYFSTKECGAENLDSSNKEVKTVNLFPLRKGRDEVVFYTLPDLTENTSHCVAIQVLDRGGNPSTLSSVTNFKTKESKRFVLRTFETENGLAESGNWTVADGPLGPLVKSFFGKNPLLWHLSETGIAGSSLPFVWRYGFENRLDYNGVIADSIVVSEVLDVRQTQGLSIRFGKFQQISAISFDDDTFELYLKILDNSNRGEWRLVKTFLLEENSKTLKLETVLQDLSAFEGKKFQIGFRFLSASSGNFIGPIIDNFEVKIDK